MSVFVEGKEASSYPETGHQSGAIAISNPPLSFPMKRPDAVLLDRVEPSVHLALLLIDMLEVTTRAGECRSPTYSQMRATGSCGKCDPVQAWNFAGAHMPLVSRKCSFGRRFHPRSRRSSLCHCSQRYSYFLCE